MTRQHLRAKTNAKIWLFVAEWHSDPVDLAAHEVFIVIGALWTAEDGRASVLIHRFGQRISETWTPNVEWIAEFGQSLADPARRRMLLMKDK
jgi:hypothetical protein